MSGQNDGFVEDGFVEDSADDGFVPDDDSGYEGFAKKALPMVRSAASTVMELPEKYLAAPTRAAIGETIDHPLGFGAIPAYLKQVGEDPKNAPTGTDLLEKVGIDVPSYNIPTPLQKDLRGNKYQINTKDLAGGAVEAIADPTMYIAPELGPMAKSAGRGIERGAEAVSKKAARVFADVPEEATARYIRNPEAVNKAPLSMQPHVERWNKMLDQLEQNIFEGSAESRLALEGKKFPRNEIAKAFDGRIQALESGAEGVIDPPLQRRISALKTLRDAYAKPAAKEVSTGYLNLDGTPATKMMQQGPDTVSGNRVKNLVQDLQRSSSFRQGAGDFIDVADIDKNEVMKLLNAKLKQNPAYAEIMSGVASDVDLMNRAKSVGGTDDALAGTFRNVSKDAKENRARTIQDVDSRLGTNFHDQLLDTVANRAFENTSANGSRRAVAASAVMAPLTGTALYHQNPILAVLLQGGATGLGMAADKYGGRMAKGAIDAINFLPRSARRIAEFASEKLPRDSKAFRMLTTAANNGPKALVITHHLLMNGDPEYRKIMEQGEFEK